jgi:hypothetical protein
MRRIFTLIAFGAVAAMLNAARVAADTHAPSAQTFTLACGAATVTVVSPAESARAAQIVDATGVGVLERVLFGSDVLFEQPSFHALKESALTTCTQDCLTLVVLMTPQGNPGR